MNSCEECEECEDQGLCSESLIKIKPYNCLTHRFIEGEPEVTKGGVLTKRNYSCQHCLLQMSHQETGEAKRVMLFGQMA